MKPYSLLGSSSALLILLSSVSSTPLDLPTFEKRDFNNNNACAAQKHHKHSSSSTDSTFVKTSALAPVVGFAALDDAVTVVVTEYSGAVTVEDVVTATNSAGQIAPVIVHQLVTHYATAIVTADPVNADPAPSSNDPSPSVNTASPANSSPASSNIDPASATSPALTSSTPAPTPVPSTPVLSTSPALTSSTLAPPTSFAFTSPTLVPTLTPSISPSPSSSPSSPLSPISSSPSPTSNDPSPETSANTSPASVQSSSISPVLPVSSSSYGNATLHTEIYSTAPATGATIPTSSLLISTSSSSPSSISSILAVETTSTTAPAPIVSSTSASSSSPVAVSSTSQPAPATTVESTTSSPAVASATSSSFTFSSTTLGYATSSSTSPIDPALSTTTTTTTTSSTVDPASSTVSTSTSSTDPATSTTFASTSTSTSSTDPASSTSTSSTSTTTSTPSSTTSSSSSTTTTSSSSSSTTSTSTSTTTSSSSSTTSTSTSTSTTTTSTSSSTTSHTTTTTSSSSSSSSSTTTTTTTKSTSTTSSSSSTASATSTGFPYAYPGSNGYFTFNPTALSYTPNNNNTDDWCRSQADIQQDLVNLANIGIKQIRLYGVGCNTFEWVLPAAAANGINVMLGFYVYDTGVDSIDSDMQNFINWIQAGNSLSVISSVAIGNEAIANGWVTAAEVIGKIASVRSQLRAVGYNGPITTVDIPGTFIDNPSLCATDVLDFVGINAHPYFDPYSTYDQSGTFVIGQRQQVQAACPGQYVRITETGYPHDGDNDGTQVPSFYNQGVAVTQIYNALEGDVILFSMWDDHWKDPGPLNVEWYWGLFFRFNQIFTNR